jgi:hypothetical protein
MNSKRCNIVFSQSTQYNIIIIMDIIASPKIRPNIHMPMPTYNNAGGLKYKPTKAISMPDTINSGININNAVHICLATIIQ